MEDDGTFTLPLCYFSTQISDLRFRLHYSHLIPLSCVADLIAFAVSVRQVNGDDVRESRPRTYLLFRHGRARVNVP